MSRYTRELLEAHPTASELEIVRLAWPDCPRALEDRERARVRRARLDLLPVLMWDLERTRLGLRVVRQVRDRIRDHAELGLRCVIAALEERDVPEVPGATVEALLLEVGAAAGRVLAERDSLARDLDTARQQHRTVRRELAEVRQALETCGMQLRETQVALQQARRDVIAWRDAAKKGGEDEQS